MRRGRLPAGLAFYAQDGGLLRPSELTRGPDPEAQHAGPPAALIGRALERCEPRAGLAIGRITVEILRLVPLALLELSAGSSVPAAAWSCSRRPRRPRRRAAAGARLAARRGPVGRRARAAALRRARGGEERPFFPRARTWATTPAWSTALCGGFLEAGPATVWMRMRALLVEGEEPTALQRVLIAADSGNGVSAALDWREHLFINTDPSVHLLRPPEGEWVCLEAETLLGPLGLADTALWDERGRIGRAAQTLLVRPRD